MTSSIVKRDVPESVKRSVIADADGCEYCGDRLASLVVEHRRPLARGGDNRRSNLVAACVSCNSQKRSMLLHEWRAYRRTHGMPWPPVATHATDPVHYCDMCNMCSKIHCALERAGYALQPEPASFICAPYELRYRNDGIGLVAAYACPMGHGWTCGWSIATWYFSDCECDFCQTSRDDAGDRTYERPPRYSVVPEDLRAAMIASGNARYLP